MKKYEIIEIPAKDTPAGRRPDRQLRVAAYCRVSTNLEMQQNSYQSQKDYYTKLIASNPAWTLAGIFADKGITGTSAAKRPAFQKMIRYCKAGKIDLVITKSISRFARNTLDCLYYVRCLQELGIPILFETEGLNTAQMDNELILTILGATSQAESEATSSRVKWGVRAAFREGRVRYDYKNWLGYRKGDDGEPEVIPEEAAVVRKIFSAYLDGFSIREIKVMLEDGKIPGKNGQETWTMGKIRHILDDEKYTGDALLQKTYTVDPISKKKRKNDGQLPMYVVKDCHEPIISHEMFDLVQAEKKRRAAVERKADKKTPAVPVAQYSSKYALSSILVCGECNTLYQRCVWRKPNRQPWAVWRCRNRLEYGRKYCKNSPTIKETALHKALVAAINSQLYRPEYLLAPFDHSLPEGTQEEKIPPAKSMEELYANLRTLQEQIDMELVDVIAQCADAKTTQVPTERIQELMKQRREYDTYIQTLHLEQHEQSYRNEKFFLPYRLTEYDDTIARHVLDTVKALSKDRLLVIFKGGATVEQTIEE